MLKTKSQLIIKSILSSYSQIFFSDGKLLGATLLLVSFFSINAGVSGIIAIIASHFSALLLGLDKSKIINGLYGFNSLLVGLGLGIYYQFSFEFVLLVIFSSVLTLFITVVMEAFLAKYGLPFLSLPFLFGIWIVSLAARHYTSLEISELGVYSYNDLVVLGGNDLLQTHLNIKGLDMPPSLQMYFVSLGAIFFQYNIYAGIIIALAILINSRISFVLSLLGFYSAYGYYQIIGANLGDLNYGYIGFNFILTAIAIGGFFIIPSWYSFLMTVLLIPILSILVSGTSEILAIYQLSTYSLAFNIVVLSMLLVLKYRVRNFRKPELVGIQQFSPEKNLYSNINFYKRFGSNSPISIGLPFFGQWFINQGHTGDITHTGDWQYAWDFVIQEGDSEYLDQGDRVKDYFCYNKPIIAPAAGEVIEIVDNIPDNEIGKMDLVHNWGNTIVIKHAEQLYSQISHIKAGSFQVYKGQWVRKGELLAHVGNSGRSPYPHLHLQIQKTAFVGSKTHKYALGPYVQNSGDEFNFFSSQIPKQEQNVENISNSNVLVQAFKFVPGQEIQWELKSKAKKEFNNKSLKWIVGVDYSNQTYIYSADTNSYAFFTATDNELIFSSYKGSKSDPLYWFYLSSFRVIFGYYKGVVVEDSLPISEISMLRIMQDFVAPFVVFIKPTYKMSYLSQKQFLDDSEIKLKADFAEIIFGKPKQQLSAEHIIISNESAEWNVDFEGERYTFSRKLS
ncbi:MAG: peptidase M23 [Bacteroidetes bacterium 4572_112]|nr:MAG: peptidase M23 [Bacteroidetes bacterium 4572_112]